MLVYQVRISIQDSKEAEWVAWMCDKHIPAVMDTGFFSSFIFSRELESNPPTYIIAYQCSSMDLYQRYQSGPAKALQQDHTNKFEGYFEASREVYELLDAPF